MRSAASMRWSYALTLFALAVLRDVHAQSHSAVPRWGQASAIIYDTLFIHGGKTDPSHQFTYTSAPNSNDLLTLDLSSPFSLSEPPWSYVSGSQNPSTSQGPTVAFHTLTPYTSSRMLLFGGDAGFATIGTNPDSAWLLNADDRLAPAWTSESTGWASEPIRRVYHAAPSASGAIYILGGQKGDNSQLGFLESYLFNAVGSDGSPAFTSIPASTDGPAALFGHAAHVLPNGILLVFGGFFSSSNSPSPFNIIYMLNTTSPSPSWSMQNVSGTVPSPRRGFASVLLNDGTMLIHGGADAALQTTYSDGASLDTTQNPMSWSPISSLSNGLGARVGHFAVPIQGRVLFGFGWAENAPASAGLALYNPTSDRFESSYTPMSSHVPVTTLPVSPTAPGGTYPTSGAGGTGGTGVGPNPTSVPGSKPTFGSGNGGSDGTQDPPKNQTVGIVVGTVLGVLAFVAFAGAGAYYAVRRRERNAWMGVDPNPRKDAEGRWQLMPRDETWDADESPTQPGEGLQMAGSGWQDHPRRGWGLLNLGVLVGHADSNRNNKAPQRLDMLADEDARQFDIDGAFDESEWDVWNVPSSRRREGTGGSSLSFGGKSTWSEMVNASVTGIRNVGAALGAGVTAVAAARQGKGRDATLPDWEKDELPLDPFSDAAAVDEKVGPAVGGAGTAMVPRGGQYPPKATYVAYVDPFSDEGEGGRGVANTRDEATDSLLGEGHDEGTLCGDALSASSRAAPDASTSVESHNAPSSNTTYSNSNSHPGTVPAGSSSSHTPSNEHSSGVSSPISPRTTSIIGAVSAPTAPMRRSDSWWSRFSRTSFRDRHPLHDFAHSTRTGGDALIDFRDPNPIPRLGPIEESGPSNPSSPQVAQDVGRHTSQGKKRRRKSGSGYAASTRSSIKTDLTADSELIEGMGGKMEVMQRALSLSSRHARSPSTVAGSPTTPDDDGMWGLSTVEASGSDVTHEKSWTKSSPDAESFTMQSPTEIGYSAGISGIPTSPVTAAIPIVPPLSRVESGVRAPAKSSPPRRALSGAVAARVSAYERRLSQDAVPLSSPRSPPADTKARRKEREEERPQHSGVGYGLVPKAPLFVANPDRRKSSGSSE